jgi:hemoglobin
VQRSWSNSALVELAEPHHINVALVHAPLAKQFADWQVSRQETAWVAILDDADEENSLTAIGAGASAILWEDMPMTTQASPNLYERLGGVYSIATVVDDLIDRVMADPRLNANPLVDDAHHKVPPAGFKYLVTEMLCWAAGGPQKYTGKDMESSHRHLRITPGEWGAFMDDVAQTLDKFAVPAAERAEVVAIVESTRRSIIAA